MTARAPTPPPMKTVKPVDGRRVRDPGDKRHRPLPDEGRRVVWSSYWQLALQAGDVELVKEPEPAPAPTPTALPPAPPAAPAPPAPAPAGQTKA